MKLVLLFLGSAIFVVIGVLMVRSGDAGGYFCGGFFALCLLVAGVQFHPGAAYLRLDADGFTFCSLFRVQPVSCALCLVGAHSGVCRIIHVGANRMVAWNFTPALPAKGGARNISKALCGYEAALPDTYGLKPQDLADILNSLLLQYGGTRSAYPPAG